MSHTITTNQYITEWIESERYTLGGKCAAETHTFFTGHHLCNIIQHKLCERAEDLKLSHKKDELFHLLRIDCIEFFMKWKRG